MGCFRFQPTLENQEMAILGFICLAVGEAGGLAASGSGCAWAIHPCRGLGLVEIPPRRRRTVRWTGHRNLPSGEGFQVWAPSRLAAARLAPRTRTCIEKRAFRCRVRGCGAASPLRRIRIHGACTNPDVDLPAEKGRVHALQTLTGTDGRRRPKQF